MLEPYRVIDLTDHRGEIGPMLLGDLGADVIRVEPPGGVSARRAGALIPAERSTEDLRSHQFRAFNRNKRSIVLDLGSAADRTDFEALIRGSDFVIESGPGGYAATHGFDFARFAALNPRIVHVLITPFGNDGPAAARIATDLTLSAMGGQAALQGAPDRAPVRISVPQIWRHAGAEAAAAAMIAHQRMQRTGSAQFADVSAQCVTTWTTMNAMDAHAIQGFNFERRGSTVQMGTREVDPVFACADGYLVALPVGTVIEPLLGHLAGEDLIDESWLAEDWLTIDQRRVLGETVRFTREQQAETLARFFRNHTKVELFAIGVELGITLAPINSVADLLHFEQIAAREAWSELALDDGTPIRTPGRIALFDVGRTSSSEGPTFEAAVRRPAPGSINTARRSALNCVPHPGQLQYLVCVCTRAADPSPDSRCWISPGSSLVHRPPGISPTMARWWSRWNLNCVPMVCVCLARRRGTANGTPRTFTVSSTPANSVCS